MRQRKSTRAQGSWKGNVKEQIKSRSPEFPQWRPRKEKGLGVGEGQKNPAPPQLWVTHPPGSADGGPWSSHPNTGGGILRKGG